MATHYFDSNYIHFLFQGQEKSFKKLTSGGFYERIEQEKKRWRQRGNEGNYAAGGIFRENAADAGSGV